MTLRKKCAVPSECGEAKVGACASYCFPQSGFVFSLWNLPQHLLFGDDLVQPAVWCVFVGILMIDRSMRDVSRSNWAVN